MGLKGENKEYLVDTKQRILKGITFYDYEYGFDMAQSIAQYLRENPEKNKKENWDFWWNGGQPGWARNLICLSSLLKTNNKYKPAAERLFAALESHGIQYGFLENTRDIWLRDFMPVRTGSGKYVSFRYEPSYLEKKTEQRTDFRMEIAPRFALEHLVYSDINLDGGNVVFSPSRKTAVISDRIFTENRAYSSAELVKELERLLEVRVIIIPSLHSDMTGHADGMVRFVDENTVVGNRTRYRFGLEMKIKEVLHNYGIEVYDFPYFDSKGDSAVGCYLNFLETEQALFLPVFDADMDSEAIEAAKDIFNKTIIPININEIAEDGGVLNCVSWEE